MSRFVRMMLALSLAGCAVTAAPSIGYACWQRKIVSEIDDASPAEQPVDEFTGEVIPPEPMLPRLITVTPAERFSTQLFSGRGKATADAVNDQVGKLLHCKVADVTRQCRLTDSQM